MNRRELLSGLGALFSEETWDLISAAAEKAFRPPSQALISDWSDQNIMVGEPSPWIGPWRTSRTPFLKQILDVCSPSHPAREIDVMKPTQFGLTMCALNVVAFYSLEFPQHGMIVLPDIKITQEWSDNRFSGMMATSPALSGLLVENRDRRSKNVNSKFLKRLSSGAVWKFAWASNAKGLSSTPAPILIADEIDRFPATTKEGEPIKILSNRFSNFPNGKFFRLSSPAIAATSRIARGFRLGDQRYYYLPCPRCNWFQRLVWDQLSWPAGGPESRLQRASEVRYRCIKCNEGIEEWRKPDMLRQAVWVATKYTPELVGAGFDSADLKALAGTFNHMDTEIHPSFHLNALVAPPGWPDQTWKALVARFETVKDNPEEHKDFVMTKLAEAYEDEAETPDEEKLFARREEFEPGVVPAQCCFVTAFVDKQKNRFEYEIVGWDERRGRWSIKYDTIPGNTSEPETWAKLQEVLDAPLPVSDGGFMPILAMGIDSGDDPAPVYEFAAKQGPTRQMTKGDFGHRVLSARTVICTKGDSGEKSWTHLIARVTTDDGAIRKRGGVPLMFIGTGFAKKGIFARLALKPPVEGSGFPLNYYHFSQAATTEYFRGLCSEKIVVDAKTGKQRAVKVDNRRNEILDIAVGNWAVAHVCVGSMDKAPDTVFRAIRGRYYYRSDEPAAAPKNNWRGRERRVFENPNLG